MTNVCKHCKEILKEMHTGVPIYQKNMIICDNLFKCCSATEEFFLISPYKVLLAT